MPTLKAGYFKKDGQKVPSVTTVLGRFKESGGLIHWAWKLGIEGKDYRAARDDAAAAGTLAHDMIERAIKGDPLPAHDPKVPEELWLQADTALASFYLWRAEHPEIEIIATEESLVSEMYGYGGTMDARGRDRGDLCILDWKTGKSLHGEAVAQCAAYRQLWNENHPAEAVGPTGHLVRFFKDSVGYEYKRVDLDIGWCFFRPLLEAHAWDKALARELK